MSDQWLVVIDPQNIFASPDSEWGSPFFGEVMPRIRSMADAFGERVLVTRWMPTADRSTSWGAYFAAWPFADQPPSDPLFELVPAARELSQHPSLDVPTFGKWAALEEIVGVGAHVVLTGVSTDCCVISTALAAADAGAHVTIAADACAGSTAANHAAAIQVMSLYPPQLTISDTAAVLANIT
ncbi:MAG TPA: nicotinamidase [Microbacterium sp.]|uniref:cysteine hydrolase family protein n=1 Tax=Microbacterium sp. TaxID=51671 RepID=UPI000EB9E042|nr:nicotinamidase [Microbacterium sp.]